MEYIAHVRKSDGTVQLLKDHLLQAKALAEKSGSKINMKYTAGLAGMLHDFGKYSDDFQIYLREAVAHPEIPPKRGSVDHSTAGAQFLSEILTTTSTEKLLSEIVGNAIISHHGGLNDYISPDDLSTPYYRRVYEKTIFNLSEIKTRFLQEVISIDEIRLYCAKAEKEIIDFIKKGKEKNEIAEKFKEILTY